MHLVLLHTQYMQWTLAVLVVLQNNKCFLISLFWVVRYFTVTAVFSVKVSLLSFRTLHQSQTWSKSCVQLPVSMNWWVSSILHTGLLSSADLNFLQPNSISGHILADWGHWPRVKSLRLLLPTSTWMCWKVCLHLCMLLSPDLYFLDLKILKKYLALAPHETETFLLIAL